jgi:hypothetical protein
LALTAGLLANGGGQHHGVAVGRVDRIAPILPLAWAVVGDDAYHPALGELGHSMRATMSAPEPGVNGTMNATLREG